MRISTRSFGSGVTCRSSRCHEHLVGQSEGPNKAVQIGRFTDAFGIDSVIGVNGGSSIGGAIPGHYMRLPSNIIGE